MRVKQPDVGESCWITCPSTFWGWVPPRQTTITLPTHWELTWKRKTYCRENGLPRVQAIHSVLVPGSVTFVFGRTRGLRQEPRGGAGASVQVLRCHLTCDLHRGDPGNVAVRWPKRCADPVGRSEGPVFSRVKEGPLDRTCKNHESTTSKAKAGTPARAVQGSTADV